MLSHCHVFLFTAICSSLFLEDSVYPYLVVPTSSPREECPSARLMERDRSGHVQMELAEHRVVGSCSFPSAMRTLPEALLLQPGCQMLRQWSRAQVAGLQPWAVI